MALAVARGTENVTYEELWDDIRAAFAVAWGKSVGAGYEYGRLLKDDPKELARYLRRYAELRSS